MIRASAAALAVVSIGPLQLLRQERPRPRIPLLHVTDLYFPPQDPDDLLDLLTVVALDEFDLKGVVLDATQKFLDASPAGVDISREPGFIPVFQLEYLLGRKIPTASGLAVPLKTPSDSAPERPACEQAGIQLLMEVLKESAQPVLISSVGSARTVAAAFNRDPQLLRSKVKAIVLNAGSTGGNKREWNVGLDLAAYICLWKSGIPIDWYPCATERSAFNPVDERGTYWKASHADLFRNLPRKLQAWIAYNFIGEKRGDSLEVLSEEVEDSVWTKICSGERNLWSTASLVMAAGRVMAHTDEGWRFVPLSEAKNLEVWPWRLDPIEAAIDETGAVIWRPAKAPSHYKLFGRKPDASFGGAMTEALNALLRSLHP